MAKFLYTGTTKEGEKITHVVEAADKFAVYDIARENGHTVTSVSAQKHFSLNSLINMERLNLMMSRVKMDELVVLTRNISSMIKAGLPLTRTLSVAERQTKNQRLKNALQSVRENINKGKQFNEGLAAFPKIFSDLYVAMVRAGEESGQLSEALATLGIQMERTSTLKKKIKGAMIYPIIVIIVMVIIGVLMMIFVVPSITATFTSLNIELPITTKILIWISVALTKHSLVVLVVFIGFFFGVGYLSRTYVGMRVLDYVFVRLPVIGEIVKEVNSARTARTLASLLHSGVNVLSAIQISKDVVQNLYYKDILDEASRRVEKGTALSEVFIESEAWYPTLFGEMIAVGEETGQIAHMLEELAQFYEAEVEQKTKDLSTIIEPILMVIIGASVGFFALAMIAPIYSISDGL